MVEDLILTGGCACGKVRFRLSGPPKRVGLCHCLTCRKAHAAAFNPFVAFDRAQADVSGVLQSWQSSPGYDRKFCAACGSRVLADNGGEVELSIGSFDEPAVLYPEYESWTVRRKPWLPALPLHQFDRDRTPSSEKNEPAPRAAR